MCNFTREIINSRRENNLVHYMFLGGQWVFWRASGFFGGPLDFLIHWPPGPVVATVQCQGLVELESFLFYWPLDAQAKCPALQIQSMLDIL